MSISLTASAADRVRSHLASRGRGLGLRLGIKTTGCSGFSYVIDYADAAAPNDLVFEDQGVKVFVDPTSFAMLDGTQVDFVRKGLNEAFQFVNPNVKAECGCGESFTV
jgi:iron-sulfur cluster assembly protein